MPESDSTQVACRLNTEEHYVTQAFERFSQVTVHQQVAFSTLADALLSLRVYLNSAILDALREGSQSQEIHIPRYLDAAESGASRSKQSNDWEMLRTLLPDVREQRLAYLLYHCGFKPKDIMLTYPQEFPDLEEISSLRRRLIQQVLDTVKLLD